SGAGYELIGERQRHRATPSNDEPSGEFWTARFKSSNPRTPPIRAFWAWSDGGEWRAPDHPRWGYARSGYLYKLYVIRGMGHLDEPIKTDEVLTFPRTVRLLTFSRPSAFRSASG